jgi:hypothetical protein
MVRGVRRLSVIYEFTFVARPASILCATLSGKIGGVMKRPPYSVAGFVLALAASLISGAATPAHTETRLTSPDAKRIFAGKGEPEKIAAELCLISHKPWWLCSQLNPKPDKPELNRRFRTRSALGRTSYFWMICRFTSARIFPQRGCKLNEPNGFKPLRRVHDRIICALSPINFAHKR